MVRFIQGDILKAEVEALVNTVNCVGVMGRGIALQFKNVFPANFRAYEAACRLREVQPGRMFVFDTGELTCRAKSSTSHQASLAGQEPDRRHPGRARRPGGRDSDAQHPVHCHSSLGQRPGWTQLGRGPAAHHSCPGGAAGCRGPDLRAWRGPGGSASQPIERCAEDDGWPGRPAGADEPLPRCADGPPSRFWRCTS